MSLSEDEAIMEFMKIKEAFVMEELVPYMEDGKLKQKVKIRLREIKEVKEEFAEKVEKLKEAIEGRYMDEFNMSVVDDIFGEFIIKPKKEVTDNERRRPKEIN